MTLSDHPRRRRTTALLGSALAATLAATTLATALSGTPAGATAPAPAGATAARAQVGLKVATTNINTYRDGSGQRAQLRRVLSLKPDVVLVQEVGKLHLARETNTSVAGIKDYVVVQNFTTGSQSYKGASAVLFRRDRFGSTALKSGFALGYSDVPGVTRPRARYLPWARIKDQATGQRINVVSVHMPTFGDAHYRKAHARMRASYQALVRKLRTDAGLPVIVGGDYNNELYNPPASQPSKKATNDVGLTFNWARSTAAQRRDCPSTIKDSRTRRIDGVAFPTRGTTLVAMRCLALQRKDDHRPVVVDLTIRTSTARAVAARPVAARAAARPDLTNVVKDNFADPGFLAVGSGSSRAYHLYATGGSFRSRTATSPRGPFTDSGSVLAARDPQTSWEKEKGHRWAPHVFRTGGRYVLWYTGTPKGGTSTSGGSTRYHDCIGAASAATPVPTKGRPATRFQPTAKPIICATRNQTLIDPAHHAQGGRHFLVYKRRTYSPSSYDIYAVEVTADGLSRKAGATPFRLVHASDGRIIEAPSLVKRGKTFWLFTSRRNYATCDYRTEVFRSASLRGGWRSAGVMDLRPAVSSARFCGPGGAEVVNDDGTYRIAFHAYDDRSKLDSRTVWTGPLTWRSGRPRVATR